MGRYVHGRHATADETRPNDPAPGDLIAEGRGQLGRPVRVFCVMRHPRVVIVN